MEREKIEKLWVSFEGYTDNTGTTFIFIDQSKWETVVNDGKNIVIRGKK